MATEKIAYHRSSKQLYTLAPWHRARSALIPIATFVPLSPSLFYTRSREKISLYWESRNEWQIEIWVTSILAHLHHTLRLFWTLYFLSWTTTQERKLYTHTPLYPLSGKSRNEWQIEIWVANHFKILSTYYTWSLSWTTYYYLNIHNNPFGEKNNSSFSIALDDPSSILTKLLCIFAHTIIPISFLTRISYSARPDLSNATTMTTEKRILIWLLINYLIKLTN